MQRVGPGLGSGTLWSGPRRATPEEAAQDYLDALAAGYFAPSRRNTTAGHPGRGRKRYTPEVEAALGILRDHRGQQAGNQGFIYMIAEGPPPLTLVPRSLVKIGYSTKPEARVGELQSGNPRLLRLVSTIEGTKADEDALHAKYAKYNVLGEWFVLTQQLMDEFTDVAERLGEKVAR